MRTDEPSFWQTRVLAALPNQRREILLRRGHQSLGQLDLPTLVDFVVSPTNFKEATAAVPKPLELRKLLIEIKQVRHRYAHETDFSAEDQIRDADTVARLLTAIAAPPSVVQSAQEIYREALERYVAGNRAPEIEPSPSLGPRDSFNAQAADTWSYVAAGNPATAKRRDITFDESQKHAISFPEKNVLVHAGAGAGKTEVLCARAEMLMERHGVGRVLVLAFSRKAASEIKSRLSEQQINFATAVGRPWIVTFHAFCYRVLRQFGSNVGLGADWEVLSPEEAAALFDSSAHSNAYKAYCLARNTFESIETTSRAEIVGDNEPSYLSDQYVQERIDAQKKNVVDYEEACASQNVVDFDSMQILLLKLLQTNPEARDVIRTKFKAILVDEYQDTTSLQVAILKELVHEKNSISVFGDQAQGIYDFRGADVRNIKAFTKHFGGVELELAMNYRSTQRITDVANVVAVQDESGCRRQVSWRSDGEMPRLLLFKNEVEETVGIADEIAHLLGGGSSSSPPSVAVLARSRADCLTMMGALKRRGIDCRVIGADGFFDKPHVSCFFALLRLLLYPGDRHALRRLWGGVSCITYNPTKTGRNYYRGLSPDGMGTWWEWFCSTEVAANDDTSSGVEAAGRLSAEERGHFHRVVEAGESTAPGAYRVVCDRAIEFLEYFYGEKSTEIVDTLESDLDNELMEKLESPLLTSGTGSDSTTGELGSKSNTKLGFGEDIERIRNLSNCCNSIEELLQAPVYESDEIDVRMSPLMVDISTIHAAKGRQWDCVYVTRVKEDAFFRSRHGEIWKAAAPVDQVFCEQRVFYVALTRARSRLTLSVSDSVEHVRRDVRQWKRVVPLRFLANIPSTAIESLRVRRSSEVGR